MTTRRSLSKLERKAHMSIHDTVEVKEEHEPVTAYTRDRFGKKQSVKTRHEQAQ